MRPTSCFVTLFILAACSPPPAPEQKPEDETVITTQLTADIGPEGGELQAPADSPLAGVRLRVPAGAVSTKTTFTIDGQLAATQLSGAAEQVGPQFIIGPAYATYVMPLELTVPIDVDALGVHDQGPEECKVWHLTGETWARLERTSGTQNTVTVQLPSPGVAAAGVLARAGISSCITNPTACLALARPGVVGNDCVNPSGYCIARLPQPQAHPVDLNPGFIVKGRKLYYAHAPAAGKITVARYDLATGQTVLFGSHPVPGLARVASAGIAVDANGDAWLGLEQFGNVRFGENRAPFVFDVGSNRKGKGAVLVGNVIWRLVFQNGEMKVTDGTVTHIINDDVMGTAVSRPTNATSFLSIRGGQAVTVDVTTGVLAEPFAGTANINTKEVAASPVNGGFTAQMAFIGQNIAMQRGNNTQITFSAGIKFLAYDADDVLHGVPLVSEMRVFDSAGGLATVPLSGPNGEASNSLRMQPLAFKAVPGRRELVLVTRGLDVPRQRDFFLIQKGD